MDQSYIILVIVLISGLFTQNSSLSIASSLLILMRLLNLNSYFPKIEAYGLKIGIIILTIGILAPIAESKYSLKDILTSVKSPLGVSSIIASILVILFTGKGYTLLTSEPSVVIPILLGCILGIVLFKGVPVGPLVSAGIALVLYNFLQLIKKLF